MKIIVHDTPAPQGSKRGFVNRHTGRVNMVESSKRVAPWREAVKTAALTETARTGTTTLTGPVVVSIVFTMPRTKGHYRTGRNAHLLRDGAPTAPAGKPDLDKLTRSTLDALTAAAVYRDDSQVVELVAAKAYPNDGREDSLPHPGAIIRVETLHYALTSAGFLPRPIETLLVRDGLL